MPPKDPETGRFIKREQVEQVQHARSIIRRAKQLGLNDEDIADQTVDSLPELIWHLERQRSLAQGERERQERTAEQAPSGWSDEPDLPSRDSSPPPGTPAPQVDAYTLDPTVYDPGLVAAFNRLREDLEDLRNTNKELRKHVETLSAVEIQRDRNSTSAFIDHLFRGMGAQFEPIFGKGGRADLANDSPEYLRRMAVINATGCQSARDPSFPKKLKDAAQKMFGRPQVVTHPSPPPRAQDFGEMETSLTREQLERWDNAALATPTAREGPPEPKGDKRAVAAVARQLREQFPSDEDDGEIRDGFLP